GMGVPPVQKGRAGRPSHFQEWKLFISHSLVRRNYRIVLSRTAFCSALSLGNFHQGVTTNG
ncbi:hypothetical protein, partial [Microcoleus sp. AT8-B4]|uniref:hypothetical protein n=1 Tax=Microcoleus sp. AT8-B4 TaxID=2818620 RepID=UPI002FCF0AEB